MENDLKGRGARHLTPALVFHTDIEVKKAEGLYVESMDGKRYMDFSSGLATANIGHCPPEVIEAAKRQMDSLIHSGCIFRYSSEIELAERLASVTPGNIDMFFFSNSGAEAVEGAVKLARYATGRQGVIGFLGGFHGRTMGALSITTSAARYRRGYHPLMPSCYHAPYPYCFRCHMGMERGSCATECFEYLEKILKYQITPEEVACMVIEPLLGEGGYIVPPADFMRKVRELCSRHGILLIADEVQSGFGRTGRWFASEHFDLEPDIIVMAKGIASGFPLSAFGASADIMSKWPPGAHGTTFGGNPVSCAAAVATIDKIEKERLLENASRMGDHLLSRLLDIKNRRKGIGDVRGLGLMIGVEFIKADGGPDRERLDGVMKRCLDAGLIIIECGADKNIARLMPPLTVTGPEIDRALSIFEEAVA
ncbi:MAG TPA: aspartate aminotransferase family protein [Deltaproteobacteria bacterium]|nr:MAG: 4-aminobutyrate aminotransferase [Deltaproteobacteria bacterium GWA2_55_82]OGQ64419.1 MAG: 4-aminobutyrate aminotransferase [Deltaproteobacteria bacterium RIFCSPLOWO2_02_FULL_55_12]OIJ72798.1 MAG: 4-aminobutyrate aminotransferase [Deltaproteobacteria bacterium GWC2_55_46]HBG46351.1 aspartate aminotransferase family protein [Deltaproteobacteria bacterium]HCY11574.1 aspartate aminotransferase family protein [Deltaproteobacteria bacterium]